MNQLFIVFRLIATVLLLLAVGDWPYSYYSIVRVAATLAAVEAAWVALTQKNEAWLFPLAAVAILWNPLVPIHLPKATWRILDPLAAVLLAASAKYVRRIRPTVSDRGSHAVALAALVFLGSAVSACQNQPANSAALPPPDVPGTIDPDLEEVGRFSLVSSGNHMVRLDTKSGKAWRFDVESDQWVTISEQPFGRYNEKTGKVEWVIPPKTREEQGRKTYYDKDGTPVSVVTDTAEALRILEKPREKSDIDPLDLFTKEENAKRREAQQREKPP